MIGKAAFSSRKANIFVAYCAQRTTKSNLVLDDEDWLVDHMNTLILDDDPDDDEYVDIRYETYFFVSDPTENHVKSNAGLVHNHLERIFERIQVGQTGGTKRVFLQCDGEFRNRKHLAWFGDVAKRLQSDFFWGVYASGHGKDLYDGEGGVFKCSARQFVLKTATRDNNPINTPADLVTYGNDHLSKPNRSPGKRQVTKRHFFYVDGEVPKAKDGVPVKGSSALYAFRARGSEGSAEVQARLFTCYCELCLSFGNCQRPGGLWNKICAMYAGGKDERDQETAEEEEEDCSEE